MSIKSRKSKSTDSPAKLDKFRHPLTNHTIDDDLKEIREFARKYEEIDSALKVGLSAYIFTGKTLDYYYGAYVTTYQMFVMAFTSENEIAPTLMYVLHAISYRIVTLLDSAKKEILKNT